MTTATHRRPQSALGWEAHSIGVPVEELNVLRTWHPNVLIGGAPDAITALLKTLRHVFQPIVVSWTAGTALPVPPASGARTLILNDVDLLSSEEQQLLRGWLKQDFRNVQVVATTTRPMLQLVESGQFDPSLYYALNVVYIKL